MRGCTFLLAVIAVVVLAVGLPEAFEFEAWGMPGKYIVGAGAALFAALVACRWR